MRPSSTLLAVSAAVLVAFSLAGCGGPSPDPTPTQEQTAAAEPATEIIEIAPWDENGDLTSDWTLDDSTIGGGGAVDAESCLPSEHGTGENTVSCGTTADATSACWITETPMQMACLDESAPDAQTVRLIGLSGPAPATTEPVEDPSPLWLELDDGSMFAAVNGGAFSPPEGFLVAYARIDGGGDEDRFEEIVVPADDSADIIDKTADRWSVTVGADGQEDVEDRTVARAWYIGGRTLPEGRDDTATGAEAVNGRWCEAPQSQNGYGCLTIALPTYTIEDTGQTWDFASVDDSGDVVELAAVDAPFGTFYPAGVPIPADSLMGAADIPDQDRIWSGQSGMMLVRG